MKGALIFAFNNDQIDYLAMARWSAINIKRHLGIPTAIVTNCYTEDTEYERFIFVETTGSNSRWFSDFDKNVIWHNESRIDAYNLSPWQETLVLDADYVVASNQLTTVLDMPVDFIAPRWAYDITGLNDFKELNYFGQFKMPMWWATIMKFRKSEYAKQIFECMSMVQTNWSHYRNLYKNPQKAYRNDHALSIALGIVNGHTVEHNSIPWSLASLTPEHKVSKLNVDQYRIDFVTADNKKKWIQLTNQDFHAMGKQQLGEIVAKDIS